MEWRALNSPQQYGGVYESGDWRIHHREAAAGIFAATLYRSGHEIVTFGGPEGLQRAQRYAERLVSEEAA